MSLEAFTFTNTPEVALTVLNQKLVPYQTEYLNVDSMAPGDGCKFSGFDAIRGMYTRGAPAIMLVGCMSIVVELDRALHRNDADVLGYDVDSTSEFRAHCLSRIDTLVSSRPTAVNLANGCDQIRRIVDAGTNLEDIFNAALAYTERLYRDDYKSNLAIGENGVRYIYDSLAAEGFSGDFAVMTICNTGSLATSGHGTALGIIRSLWERSLHVSDTAAFRLAHVYACETRPYNQGSRLTAYELDHDKIPFSLITDNMASFLIDSSLGMHTRDRGVLDVPVKFIIVGADRIVMNGDLANKIGTFQLSLVSSNYPQVKFIGAAPTTTIDHQKTTGEQIKIEQRPANELTEVTGGAIDSDGAFITDAEGHVKLTKVKLAPQGIDVWNPAFDVTPHKYIDCIVTENGYVTKNDGEFYLE